MEQIILEIQANGLNQYHHIDEFPVTIGRAYDNDIILSDRSISAHHVIIECSEQGKLVFHNLSNENGTILNSKKLDNCPTKGGIPSVLNLGHIQLRIVSPSTRVETTYKNECDHIFCAMGQRMWSAALLFFTMGVLLLERYLETPYARDALYYFTLGFPYFIGILISTLFFATISRLTVHRWHFLSIMSIITLLILFSQFLSNIGHSLNYFFSSNTPLEISAQISYFILPLLLIFFFTKKIYRTNIPMTLGIAFVISFFYSLPYTLELIDSLNIEEEYAANSTNTPPYNKTLSSLDIRAQSSLSVDEFIQETQEKLSQEVRENLMANAD